VDLEFLVRPISESAPCGVDLDGTALLGEFDRLSVFGQWTPLTDEVDWPALRRLATEAISQSRDIRPLTYLGAAELRLSGLDTFVVTLEAAAHWLAAYWDDVYPRIDEDAILRQNSLCAFADPMAVVDALRRTPLVNHRQLGSFSLRDIDIAKGTLQPAEDEQSLPTEAQISSAFAAASADELKAIQALIGRASAAAGSIESVMSDRTDGEAVPDLSLLIQTLKKAQDELQPHLEAYQQHSSGGEGLGDGEPGPGQAQAVATGPIRTREDAIRALDAVAEFFRRNEPSSPVPLFADRAKRLIKMDFVQLLGEIAPGALPEVRGAAGLRDED
jgi:type VI secretion system protein ImpA